MAGLRHFIGLEENVPSVLIVPFGADKEREKAPLMVRMGGLEAVAREAESLCEKGDRAPIIQETCPLFHTGSESACGYE